MRVAIALLALSSAGCGSLLGLDDFTDTASTTTSATSGTGASGAVGGAGGMGAGGAGGGTGGAGGDGGEKPSLDCQNVGVPFDVFSAADVANAELDERHYLVPDDSSVHVVVIKYDGSGILARTVRDSDLSPIATWTPPMNMGAPRIAAGHRTGGDELRMVTVAGNEIGYVDFGLQQDEVDAGVMATFNALPAQPTACGAMPGGNVRQLAVAYDSGAPRFAVTCESMSLNQRTLYVGDETSFTQVEQGSTNDEGLDVRHYAVTPTHLMVSGADFGGATFVRYGTTPAELATRHEFKLSNDANHITGSPSLIPAPMQIDGVTVIAARLGKPPGPLVPADMYTGTFTAADYVHFTDVPPAELTVKETIDAIDDMPLTERFYFGPNYITGAGTNVGLSRVMLSYFRRDGTVEIFGQEIYTAPGGAEILRAFAAPAGLVNVLVTWTEKSGALWSVRAQRLICG